VTSGPRRTKILCTVGPASTTPVAIGALVAAGMDAARLNFSHGTWEEHEHRARLVRDAQREAGRPLALVADLQGPKLRLGQMPGERELQAGDAVVLAGEDQAQADDLPVNPAVLADILRPGHHVLLNDGRARLRVERVRGGRVSCRVEVGGPVSTGKGVNVPGVPLPVPSLTEKDADDLEFALGLGVDFVALSFVRSPEDVRVLRERLHAAGSTAHVVAKIEKGEAVEQLEAIVEASDAVMVARGDLGVEIGPAAVPLVQKRVIQCALDHGKPAITATQMLESMIERPEPTRAEASDVANAILDGSAAVMLSGETAIGGYPVESVRAIDGIARAVEPSLPYRHELASAGVGAFPTVVEAVTNAACDIAELLSARAILVPTYSGRTASDVARHRPRRPIVAVSHRAHSLQQLALEWGVVPRAIDLSQDVEHLWTLALEAARGSGVVAPGDRIVITGGSTVNTPGTTNLIKVVAA
jgi:pyruvate kinase